MSQRITVVIDINDEAWDRMMSPMEDFDGTILTPTPEEMLEHFVDYARGAWLSEGVTYSGMVELIDPGG